MKLSKTLMNLTKTKIDPDLKKKLIPALRKLWRNTTRYQHIQAARIARGQYQCQYCLNIFKAKELQINHDPPIGKLYENQ